jgi:hypothetical protein
MYLKLLYIKLIFYLDSDSAMTWTSKRNITHSDFFLKKNWRYCEILLQLYSSDVHTINCLETDVYLNSVPTSQRTDLTILQMNCLCYFDKWSLFIVRIAQHNYIYHAARWIA